jgi:hypothetical protein
MKTFSSIWKITAAGVVLAVSVWIICAPKKPQGEILAIVGDRVITADEFIRRAEYTIRPPYCKRNSNIDKTIILNSLIAEKLFSFEAGKDNPVASSPSFQAFIRGRKEQMMRQILLTQTVKKKITPDTSELNKRYRLAGRAYRVAYCSIGPDAARFAEEQKNGSSRARLFESVYRYAGGLGPPAERTILWKSQENRAVHRALFSEPLVKDQVIGPVRIDADQFLMLKVLGWTDRPAITDSDVQRRNNEVFEDWEREKAEAIWDAYIIGLMRNKRLDFKRDTFEKMAELFQPLYTRSDPKILPFINRGGAQELPLAVIDSVGVELKKQGFEDRPFFTFDGKTWTVTDFLKSYASHPLVFRKSRFSDSEFPDQFKLAVADLMRDQIVNQAAYDKGIDRSPSVQTTASMWRDALIAKFQQSAYLQAKTDDPLSATNFEHMLDDYLNPYSDSLFSKYSNNIRINIPVFERIKLTRIDMIALNENVPYLETVPPFPILTNKYRLNYGKKLE